jgi:large subunit ribosomal protein L29
MPILRMREIRDMSAEERKKRLGELKVELNRLKTTVESGGTVENPSRIREIRRTIARILTVQREMGEVE